MKKNNVAYVTSEKLGKLAGFRHAFPCMSGEKLESIDRLVARMKDSFGLEALLIVKQVHGTEVAVYDGPAGGEDDLRNSHADAVATGTPGIAVGIRTADCVPVLIASPGKAVAAVHGGWKGIIGGIMEKAVQTMAREYGADPTGMVAAIGPHIGSCCYEVGPDVADPFREKFGDSVVKPGRKERPHLDLAAAAKISLQKAGLNRKNIDSVAECTNCQPGRFYSYRRDGKPTGRQLSFIVIDRAG